MDMLLEKAITQRTGDVFYVVQEYRQAFTELGLTSIDAVFDFNRGQDLVKTNIASYRSRLRFNTTSPERTLFLKRYDHPPLGAQIRNWVNGGKRRSCSMTELEPLVELASQDIATPRPIAHGQTWSGWWESRSFLITEKIPNASSLANELPGCFYQENTIDTLHQRQQFVRELADFIRRFHALGYRHRDLYLNHIFRNVQGRLYLIDLARAFKPSIRKQRFLIKDLAQVFYSLPADHFTRTDRLRFYLAYAQADHLSSQDKTLVRNIITKAERMARHNLKHGRLVPFLTKKKSTPSKNNRMKIAIIIERANVHLGGAERSISELTESLKTKGLDVTLLVASGDSTISNVRVLCTSSPGKRVSLTSFEKALKIHLTQTSYDIIHSVLPFGFADVYQPRGGTYAETILRSAASYENKSVELIKRLTAFFNHRRQKHLSAERSLSSGAEGPVIAALSQYVIDQFKRHYDTPEKRLTLITNGVKINGPINGEACAQLRNTISSRFHFKADDQPVLFLFAGHNFRLKGLKPLLYAFAKARQQVGASFYLIVAGHGNRQMYRSLMFRSQLKDSVLFIGDLSHIQNVIQLCDVAILPTFYDPASRFILEALAAQKPVITTRYNGAIDLFEHNRHGIVVDSPTCIEELSQAIRRLSDRHTIAEMSSAIKADGITEKVSIERVADELIALYSSILKLKGMS